MKIGFIGSKNRSFKIINAIKYDDAVGSYDYVLVDHNTVGLETRTKKVFYGDLESLNYSESLDISYFFSRKTKEHELISFLKDQLKGVNQKKTDFNDKVNVKIQELENNIKEKNHAIKNIKEGSIEIKGLREYVVRLMSVNTVEQLVYETERLRILRYKGVRLSLIYTDENTGFLCTKGTLKKIPLDEFQNLKNLQNSQDLEDLQNSQDLEDLQNSQDFQEKMQPQIKLKKNLANILSRPVLSHFHFKIYKLNEKEKIYVLFESDSDFCNVDYFLNMLFKLMITNFIRVLQSEKLVKISSLISLAFSQIQNISILVGKDHEIKISNQKESIGKKCFKYIFNQDEPCVGCPIMKPHNLGNSSHELEEQNYVVHASNLEDFKGLYHLHIYESKVNSLKRESLKIQRGKLQSLGMVTTALTHELNNPLTGIYELSKDLAEVFEGQISEDFSEMSKSAKRCLLIIENLKNFSSKKIDFERIQLSKIIQDALSLTKIMVRSVKLNCELDQNVWISGSSTIISQAIFNIIKNSIEAMNYKGVVSLKLFKKNQEAYIHFEDKGPGLPESFNEIALFRTQKKTKGAGYGMFLVYEFVKLHGGQLNFGNNKDGKGAYFTMRFPLEKQLEK